MCLILSDFLKNESLIKTSGVQRVNNFEKQQNTIYALTPKMVLPSPQSKTERWSVFRRYSDFIRLHHLLATTGFRREALPRLPPKLFFHSRSKMAAREEELNKFLQVLIEAGLAAKSEEVRKFLEVPRDWDAR